MQLGFHKGLGACDALLIITHFVQRVLDCFCVVCIVGLDFSAAFDRLNHESLIFELRLVVGGPFLSIRIEFLSSRLQRFVVDGHCNEHRNAMSGVPQGSVLDPLHFMLYIQDMWSELENMFVSYANEATLLVHIPFANMKSDVTESLNRDLSKIITWCNLWSTRLNLSKTQSMIISKTIFLLTGSPWSFCSHYFLGSCDY